MPDGGTSSKVAAAPQRKRRAKPPAPQAFNGDARLGELSDFIGFHLRIAQDASFRAFAKHVGQRGLKPGRFAAMMLIHNNPGISQIAVSRAIARDKSTVTPLIQELQRGGLVDRRRSTTDGRSVTLTLTPRGETMILELLRRAREHDNRLDRIVGDAKPELIRVLKKIADGLT
jgi:DNA-binding MarR family transcriptional regulator